MKPDKDTSDHKGPERMVHRRSWGEFRASGLLWWINSMLHLWGWALVIEMAEDGKTISNVYPAHCKFRGFSEEHNDQGYRRLTHHARDNISRMLEDLPEEPDIV